MPPPIVWPIIAIVAFLVVAFVFWVEHPKEVNQWRSPMPMEAIAVILSAAVVGVYSLGVASYLAIEWSLNSFS